MIEAHKLNGEIIHINSDLIRYIESHPDTVLTFVDGRTLTVRETPEQLMQKIFYFRRQCWPTGHSNQGKDSGPWT